MKDTDIFIFSQDVPKEYPKSEEYKLITLEPITKPCDIQHICIGDYNDPIFKMEHAYSECARIHALWKNYPLQKYVGTAHYRRYLEFYDEVPDLDEIFKKYDVIFDDFDIGWPTTLTNYRGCHNVEDLLHCVDIIRRDYPDFAKDADEVLNGKFFVPCNIFLTTREMFIEWCEFVFGVLEKFDNEMGFETDLDVCNYVVNNMDKYVDNKGGIPNNRTDYQARIQAFLSERLSTIFFHHTSKNHLHQGMVMTEIKYDFEKTYFRQYAKQNIRNNN